MFAIKCPGAAGCRKNLRDASQKEQVVITRRVSPDRVYAQRVAGTRRLFGANRKKKNRRRFPPSSPFVITARQEARVRVA